MLESQRFLIREHAADGKSAGGFEVCNPDTGEQIGLAKKITGSLRFALPARFTPLTIEVREKPDESLVFCLHRPLSLFRTMVNVYDADGKKVGYIKLRDGGVSVCDADNHQVGEFKGDWSGKEARFHSPEGRELAKISRQQTVEQIVTMVDELAEQPISKMLLLSAVLAMSMRNRK